MLLERIMDPLKCLDSYCFPRQSSQHQSSFFSRFPLDILPPGSVKHHSHHSHHSQVLDSDWHETSPVEIQSKNLNRSSKCSFEVPQMDGMARFGHLGT